MTQIRPVEEIVTGSRQTDGAGVKLVRVLGPATTKAFDPFLMLDAFDSRNPDDYTLGFPWHPHRGIETVTYLVSGAIEHGDSLGNRGTIRDGGCQWMTAGSGIIHQEMPQASPRMLGLQLWVNLPRQEKMTPPQYRDIRAEQVPQVREGAATVRIVAGTHGGIRGATQGDHVKVLLLDVTVDPHAEWTLPVEAESTLFIYLIEGAAALPGAAKPVASHRAVRFGSGDLLTIAAGDQGVRFILFAGRPLREPIAWGGPIVMNTQAELQAAFAELDAGTFIH